ncbi:unnamed protein product [Prunus brigantina]
MSQALEMKMASSTLARLGISQVEGSLNSRSTRSDQPLLVPHGYWKNKGTAGNRPLSMQHLDINTGSITGVASGAGSPSMIISSSVFLSKGGGLPLFNLSSVE